MHAPEPCLAVVLYMAKHHSDRTTLDLFADEKRPGRPKTNPHPRDLQLKNKRNQLKRDKDKGLHRVELKLDAESLDDLNQLADARGISRSELIQELVREYVSTQRSSQLK
jgi:hypothetical protein